MDLNPYLGFDGTCAEAFAFYAKVLGGKIDFMMKNGESPMADQTPPEQRDRVMHARLTVGDKVILGGDAPPQYFSKPQGFCVSIGFPDNKKAAAAFAALAEGGQTQMAFAETFWSEGFGMLIDRYGIPWMVSGVNKPMPA